MLRIYHFISCLAEPFLHLWWQKRAGKGKEDKSRKQERFGRSKLQRPNGDVIWVHAASVGESHSILPLIHRITDAYPHVNVLLTTGTCSSARLASSRLPERGVHQYIPYDIPRIAKRFLKHWKPKMAIFVESELWPNLLKQTHDFGCPMLLVNGRMSGRSYKRWMRYRRSIMTLLGYFTAIFPGSRLDYGRFNNLGAQGVRYIGNLKYDAPALEADPKSTAEILGAIGDRRVWLAASTHDGEEAMIGAVHHHVRDTYSDAITILAPRHPHRADAIVKALKALDLDVACRSKGDAITPETDIYLADTLGELGIFYRLCGVCFVGGSLVEVGGHNPIEPAQLDCAIITGPHTDNFSAVITEFKEAHALVQVADAEALAEKITLLLRDQDAQEALAKAAHDLVEEKEGVICNIMEQLAPHLGALPAECESMAANHNAVDDSSTDASQGAA